MTTCKSVKVTESLQSPQAHKELLGDGQQLKRQTLRSRSASQQSQGVSKPDWWVFALWSRYTLWFSSSWLHTTELAGMSYFSLVTHTQQYYTGDKVLLFAQVSFQRGIWMWAQGHAVHTAYKTARLNSFPCRETLSSQRIQMKAAGMVTCTGHLPQKQWSDIVGLTFHKSFWKPNPIEVKGIYYQWFKIQLTSLNSRHSILSK